MTADENFTCPVCRYGCRPNSVLCPECGVQFENWLRDNPGQSIPGWKTTPTPPAPAPGPQAVPPSEQQPTEPALTPEAREALLIQEMEKTASLRNSPSAKAGRKAGGLLMMLAAGNIIMAVLMNALGMAANNNRFFLGAVDALVLGPLAVGTYMGNRKWGMWGIGYFGLSTVASLLLPGGDPGGQEVDFEGITAAANALGNVVVAFILYWFIRKMEPKSPA